MEKGNKNNFLVGGSVFLLAILLTTNIFAQNVADSDLSNRAGTNSNWDGNSWLWAIIIISVILILGAIILWRRNKEIEHIEEVFKKTSK